MRDLKADLAVLRIERKPETRGPGRTLAWTVAILAIAGVAAIGWRWLSGERPATVEAATVTERGAGQPAAVLNASGYVTARRRATVSSKITAKVIMVDVEEGTPVREGQVLARLDDSNGRAALALAEAQVEAARRAVAENEVRLADARLTLRRRTQLLTENVASQAEIDQAKADADTIEARIAALRQQIEVAERQVQVQRTDLDNYVIRAPFSGIAITKDAQPGEMVSPVSAGGGFTRTGICTIVDMKSLEIDVDVNESYINRVTRGQDVTAVLDAYPDWRIPSRVITTVPTADRQKATVLVRIGFIELDPRILPDMGVKVTFLRSEDETREGSAQPMVLVPKGAVRTDNGQSIVFVAVGGRVERRAIKTGGTDGDRIEAVAGLRGGEQVVLSPPTTMKDGDAVTIK